jgi:endoglucanase
MRAPLIMVVIAALVAALAVGAWVRDGGSNPDVASAASTAVAAGTPHGLHVSGNALLDARNRRVQFHAVNRSGTEYACVQGWGIFDGPSDARSAKAIASWHVNGVRLPLNEHCWLGINGVKPQYAGASYRKAIVKYVTLLNRYGIYVELSLMWAAPGAYQATYQSGGPDADHAPAFWASLARTFRHNPNVILAPWGETIVDANCFLKGGVCEATFGPDNRPYQIAGMQQAVDVMRGAGYRGVIAIPGIDYANNLSEWLSHRPRDPLNQLVAEAHVYPKNTCGTIDCFQDTFQPITRSVPMIFGELGNADDEAMCGLSYMSQLVDWADEHHVGYFMWTWDTWRNCSALISDYSGTPFSAYGKWVKRRYAATHSAARPIPG